jgi:predicted small secreted protein
MSQRQYDAKATILAIVGVIEFQSLAQQMQVNADNGVRLWIKTGRASQSIDGDTIFLKVGTFPTEVFLANIGKNLR